MMGVVRLATSFLDYTVPWKTSQEIFVLFNFLVYAFENIYNHRRAKKVEFRIATLNDLDLLTTSRIEVLKAANKLDASTDMANVEKESYNYYKKALEDNTHYAILVMEDDKFIGAGGVSFYSVMPTYHNPSGKKAYIMNMYTAPDYRRQGIAYKTLDLLVKVSKERGINQISLEATEMGRPLYEKYGFVKMESEMELV